MSAGKVAAQIVLSIRWHCAASCHQMTKSPCIADLAIDYPQGPLDSLMIRALSVAADVDPRTFAKEVRTPGAVRGRAGERIRAALRTLV